MAKVILVLFCVGISSGCVSSYKDFKMSQVKPGEGVSVGRVKVKYNGGDKTEDCAVCLNSINGPCQSLTKDGFFIFNIPTGAAEFRRVACKDVSVQHHNLEGYRFQQGPGITYIGDITIDWKNTGGFKTSDMFGLVGALADQSKNDGQMKIQIGRDPNLEAVRVFEKQTGEKSKVTESLIAAPR